MNVKKIRKNVPRYICWCTQASRTGDRKVKLRKLGERCRPRGMVLAQHALWMAGASAGVRAQGSHGPGARSEREGSGRRTAGRARGEAGTRRHHRSPGRVMESHRLAWGRAKVKRLPAFVGAGGADSSGFTRRWSAALNWFSGLTCKICPYGRY